MTKQETLDSIKSITNSWYRHTRMDYDHYHALIKNVEVWRSQLIYREMYRRDGTLWCKGLCDAYSEQNVGTWWYCDSAGQPYREYDFSASQMHLYKNKQEPLQWMLDSVMRTAQREFERRYGPRYAAKHIFITSISWYAEGEGYGSNGKYPFLPDTKITSLHVEAQIRYDSVTVGSDYLYFDSNAVLVPPDRNTMVPRKTKPFLIGFHHAHRVALEEGYEQPTLYWDDQFHDFYWATKKCVKTSDPYDDEDCSHKRISATTGEPIPYIVIHSTTCSPSTEYTNYCPDTTTVPPGHKEIGFAGANFVTPMNWLVTTVSHGYTFNAKSYLTNGTDTLFGESDCMSWGHMLYRNTTVFDTVSMSRFKQRFPNGLQGRGFNLEIVVTGEDRYDIHFTVLESINAMHCGTITYKYDATGVSGETRDVMLGIFASMNFLYCLPE